MKEARCLTALGLLAWFLGSAVPALAAAPAAPAAPANMPAALTAEQWREDLRFMAAEMKRRHENLYHTITPQQFDSAVADLDRRIPTL